jgi:hypothetical protein
MKSLDPLFGSQQELEFLIADAVEFTSDLEPLSQLLTSVLTVEVSVVAADFSRQSSKLFGDLVFTFINLVQLSLKVSKHMSVHRVISYRKLFHPRAKALGW